MHVQVFTAKFHVLPCFGAAKLAHSSPLFVPQADELDCYRDWKLEGYIWVVAQGVRGAGRWLDSLVMETQRNSVAMVTGLL